MPSTQLGLMCGNPMKPTQESGDEPEAGVHRRRRHTDLGRRSHRTRGPPPCFPCPQGHNQSGGGTIRAGEVPALGPGAFPVPAFPPERRSRPAEDRSSPGFEPAPGRRAVRAAGPQPPPDVADFAAPAFSCPLYLGFIDSC